MLRGNHAPYVSKALIKRYYEKMKAYISKNRLSFFKSIQKAEELLY